MSAAEVALKPCPFCGARHIYIAPCEHGSGMFGPAGAHKQGCIIGCIDFADYADVSEAIAAWNRRTPERNDNEQG